MAGLGNDPVLVFRTCRDLHWEYFHCHWPMPLLWGPLSAQPLAKKQAVGNHTDFVSGRFLAEKTALVGY
jgi:hypothetical protein